MGIDSTELHDSANAAVNEFRRLQRLGLVVRSGEFFPSMLYPPLNMHTPIDVDVLYEGYVPPDDGLFSTYINVPFCTRRCSFCHIPVELGRSDDDKIRYIDTLEREMDLALRRFDLSRIRTRSMLYGGGTSTDLPPEVLDRLMNTVASRLDLEPCTQISADVDPLTLLGSIGDERLDVLRRNGVSRVAIGVQDLDEGILRQMVRKTTVAQIDEVIDKCRARGMKINIELIFGYPGQSLESWTRSMLKAVSLPVDEIQVYRLQIIPYRERSRANQGMYRNDPSAFPTPDDAIRMQRVATELLTRHGFHENRRRFYTRTPEDYSHYQHSWTGKLQEQVGFGTAAMNYLRDRYGQNYLDLASYTESVNSGRTPIERGMVRDEDAHIRWAFVFPLRHYRSDIDVFRKATGRDLFDTFARKTSRLRDEGLIEDWDDSRTNADGSTTTTRGLRLTPLGSFFVDEVVQQFHDPRYLVFPEDAYEDGPLNPYRDNDPSA